ncbi:hypothetical protein [Roseisalinus antarcticus]|nr:hypothetical protein [Roseisalinus antarcticus]
MNRRTFSATFESDALAPVQAHCIAVVEAAGMDRGPDDRGRKP